MYWITVNAQRFFKLICHYVVYWFSELAGYGCYMCFCRPLLLYLIFFILLSTVMRLVKLASIFFLGGNGWKCMHVQLMFACHFVAIMQVKSLNNSVFNCAFGLCPITKLRLFHLVLECKRLWHSTRFLCPGGQLSNKSWSLMSWGVNVVRNSPLGKELVQKGYMEQESSKDMISHILEDLGLRFGVKYLSDVYSSFQDIYFHPFFSLKSKD